MNRINPFNRIIYMKKNYAVNLLQLNDNLLINVLGFFSLKEKIKYSQICRTTRDQSMHPCLWREINIFSRQNIVQNRFCSLVHRSSQLRILSLKFCPNVSGETLTIIAEEANPFYLRELYLDGCDKINDHALANLTIKRQRDIDLPDP